jgi:hypothetical protein
MDERMMDQIMGLIYDHVEGAPTGLTDSATLARQIDHGLAETEAWVLACERQGWLSLDHAAGEEVASVRAITLAGRLHVEHQRH